MPDRDRICLECGHSYAWHTRERTRDRLGTDAGVERVCYRRIGSQSCPCPGFRRGNERVVAAPLLGSVYRSAALSVLLVVLGLALLYAYRSQSPAIQQVPITQAIQDVQAGAVKAVTITGSKATLEYTDGATKKQTNLPEGARGDDPLAVAISQYNAANPTRPVQLKYEEQSATFSVIGSILLSLLPVLLIGGFFFYMMDTMRRNRDD